MSTFPQYILTFLPNTQVEGLQVDSDRATKAIFINVRDWRIYATPDFEREETLLLDVEFEDVVVEQQEIDVCWTGDPETDLKIWKALVGPFVKRAKENPQPERQFFIKLKQGGRLAVPGNGEVIFPTDEKATEIALELGLGDGDFEIESEVTW